MRPLWGAGQRVARPLWEWGYGEHNRGAHTVWVEAEKKSIPVVGSPCATDKCVDVCQV